VSKRHVIGIGGRIVIFAWIGTEKADVQTGTMAGPRLAREFETDRGTMVHYFHTGLYGTKREAICKSRCQEIEIPERAWHFHETCKRAAWPIHITCT